MTKMCYFSTKMHVFIVKNDMLCYLLKHISNIKEEFHHVKESINAHFCRKNTHFCITYIKTYIFIYNDKLR